MEYNNLLLIMQLIRSMGYQVEAFEKAYNNSDKDKFESSKKSLLELQNKINFIIKNNVS